MMRRYRAARRCGSGSGNGSCAGKGANGVRTSRVAGVTALIEQTHGRATQPSGIELGLAANSSFKRPGLRREGPMGIIVSLIIGGVIGWLASLVMKTGAQMGVIANIIVGIIGAVLGSWLAGRLGIVAVGSSGAWIISILGAVVLIAILKALNIYQ